MMSNLKLFGIFLIFVICLVLFRVYKFIETIKLKYLFVPFPKTLINKYLNEDWDIDKYNHILRMVQKNRDVTSLKKLLGAVRVNSWSHLYNITIGNEALTPAVLDVYSYDSTNKKLKELIFSIADPKNITLGAPPFCIPDGFYVPLLRVGGELSKDWLSNINIMGPIPKCFKHKQVYKETSLFSYFQEESVPEEGEKYDFFEKELVPNSKFIKKSGLTLSTYRGNTLTLFYRNRVKEVYGGLITANIIGGRIEDIYGPQEEISGICKKVWDLNTDKDVVLSETVYGFVDNYKTPYLTIS